MREKLFLAGLAVLALIWLACAASADDHSTLGYRIELRACRGDECRDLKTPDNFWTGRYACQGRADRIAEEARERAAPAFDLPADVWRFTARCAPVLGLAGA